MITKEYIRDYKDRIEKSAKSIEDYIDVEKPDVVIQQGSAIMETFMRTVEEKGKIVRRIPYTDIGFPELTVENHTGELIVAEGNFGEKGKDHYRKIWLLKGRHHYYESGSPHEAAFIVRVCLKFGAKNFILLNASGGLADIVTEGEVVFITDCASSITSPNIGYYDTNQRFVNCSDLFDRAWYRRADPTRSQSRGTYFAVQGPEYESPRYANDLKERGYDMVGMSTVPEVWAIKAEDPTANIVAASLVTNHHLHADTKNLSHAEVSAIALQNEGKLAEVVECLVAVV